MSNVIEGSCKMMMLTTRMSWYQNETYVCGMMELEARGVRTECEVKKGKWNIDAL